VSFQNEEAENNLMNHLNLEINRERLTRVRLGSESVENTQK
jgi:hypothetical protein